jgi:hypothetical protein
MPEDNDRLRTFRTIWAIYVDTDDNTSPPFIREVMTDVPIGRAFEAGQRYMRDEGWDTVSVKRRVVERKP